MANSCAAKGSLEAQYWDISGHLERHHDAMLHRIEELFERQHRALANVFTSMQWAPPLDDDDGPPPPPIGQAEPLGAPSRAASPLPAAAAGHIKLQVAAGPAATAVAARCELAEEASAFPAAEADNDELHAAAGPPAARRELSDVSTQTGGAGAPSGFGLVLAPPPPAGAGADGVQAADSAMSVSPTMDRCPSRRKLVDVQERNQEMMRQGSEAIELPTGAAATAAFVAAADGRLRVEVGPDTAWWRRMVASEWFDKAAGLVITLNACVMVVQLEQLGLQSGGRLGANTPYAGDWDHAEVVFLFFEHLFCLLFIVELTLRVLAFRAPFFCVVLNWVDVITVLFTIVELYVLPVMKLNLPNLTFVRLVRLLRLIKVLRVVRVMRLFRQLRVLVVAVASSVGALVWSIIFLTVMQAIAALLMTQAMSSFIGDERLPYKVRADCYHYFGRWTHSMLTTYQITFAPGEWGPIGRLLIFDVSWVFVLFFIAYGWLITFAVVRVISAMFLKQTMAAAAGDGEVAIVERMEKKDKDVAKLRDIFAAGDSDGSGQVDWDEFQAMLEKPDMRARLAMLELDVDDMKMLFKLLDKGDGSIAFDAFISGVMRCRGGARGVDVASLLSESQSIVNEIQEIRGYLEACGLECKTIEFTTEGDRRPHMLDEQGEDLLEGLGILRCSTDTADIRGEPKWRRFVRSRQFDMVAGVFICLNAVVMSLELEHNGLKVGAALGFNSEEAANWTGAEVAFEVFDHFFCLVFLAELILRIVVNGLGFFKQVMNLIDVLIVALSVLEIYVMKLVVVKLPSMQVISLLRLLRLTKVARIVRVLKLFHQLRVLVMSITATIGSLGWSIVFLIVVQLICAIFMTQVLQDYLADPDHEAQVQQDAHRYFGRWTHAMLTMHQLTLAPGAWGSIGRLLIFKVSPSFVLFFVPFGWLVTFAMVNVISAIFLKQTLAAAAGDSEVALLERMAKKRSDIARLREIFSEGDNDGSGTVDWGEFQEMVRNPRVRAWLGILELDITDMSTVFNLLDDGDGQIEFDEFISGVMKCRGAARGVEVVNLLCEYRDILLQLHEMKSSLRSIMGLAQPGQTGPPPSIVG